MGAWQGGGKRRAVVVAGAIVLLLAAGVAARDAAADIDYGAEGRFPTARIDSSVVDDATGRSVGLATVFPSDDGVSPSPSVGACPLVILSHGFLLRGENYLSYAERLASHGFIVGLPTYQESLVTIDHSALAVDLRSVIDRYAAMNADEGSPFYQRIDMTRLALSGHSLGGKISLLVAAGDDRVAACALLDPVDSAPFADDDGNYTRFPSVTPELMPDIRAPLLLIGAELGGKPVVLLACAPPEDNYEQYFDYAESPAIEITQNGAGHMQYVDDPIPALVEHACAAGTADANWVKESAAAYMTSFLTWTLYDDPTAKAWLEQRLQDDASAGLIAVRRK